VLRAKSQAGKGKSGVWGTPFDHFSPTLRADKPSIHRRAEGSPHPRRAFIARKSSPWSPAPWSQAPRASAVLPPLFGGLDHRRMVKPPPMRIRRSDRAIATPAGAGRGEPAATVGLVLLVALQLWLILAHAPWRDELQAFLLAR